MSRKHKSRKPKITQTNAPAPFTEEKKSTQTNVENVKNETLPEKPVAAETETAPTAEVAPANHATPESSEPSKQYSLDDHYAQQSDASVSGSLNEPSTQNENETPAAAPVSEAAASLNEYEQLKRKNRRRLVGAGALVLVAGSLFAAASKDSTQTNPKLTATKVVEQQVLQPEILRPAGSENKIDLSMDDEKGAPLVLKNNMVANKQPKPAQNTSNMNSNKAASNTTNNKTAQATQAANANSSSESRAKAREEARAAEERRQKAQSRAAEAEAKRLEAERAIANKAKTAQAAADRNRNAERAQLTVERAAQEKQRAQRQAATTSNNHASKSNGKSSSIQAGAFSDREAARRMQQQLKNLNYAARVEEVQTSKGKIYRVRTGDFSNQADAKNALNKLQNKGVNAMVVGK